MLKFFNKTLLISIFSFLGLQTVFADQPVLFTTHGVNIPANQDGTTPADLNKDFGLEGTIFAVSEDAFCYLSDMLDLEDPEVKLGQAVDCITPEIIIKNTYRGEGFKGKQGVNDLLLKSTTTTFFMFNGTKFPAGNIVSVAPVNALPINPNFGAPTFGTLPTHTASAVNVGNVGGVPGNTIIPFAGTGTYENATGSVRLSGAIDLSEFNFDDPNTKTGFSCIFVISLDD